MKFMNNLNVKYDFEIQRITRSNMLNLVNDLTIEELTKIPEGFKNNILWNFGHVIITQQLLIYKNSGLTCNVSDYLIQSFGKGSKPIDYNKSILDELKLLLTDLVDQTVFDFKDGAFKDYIVYQTSYNATLKTVEEAIRFNNIHESLHLGYMMSLKHAI